MDFGSRVKADPASLVCLAKDIESEEETNEERRKQTNQKDDLQGQRDYDAVFSANRVGLQTAPLHSSPSRRRMSDW